VTEDQADILCNECEAVILSVPLADLERVVRELAQTDTVCTAVCTHCGVLNTFPGMVDNRGLHLPRVRRGRRGERQRSGSVKVPRPVRPLVA
jgi:hypothetical protein